MNLRVDLVVPSTDDGGGSGKIRKYKKTRPPGDQGNALSAKAPAAIRGIAMSRIDGRTPDNYTAEDALVEVLNDVFDTQQADYNILDVEDLRPVAFIRDLLFIANRVKADPKDAVFGVSGLRLADQTLQNLMIEACNERAGATPGENGIIDSARAKVADYLASNLMRVPLSEGRVHQVSLGSFDINTNRLYVIYKTVLSKATINAWCDPEAGHIKDPSMVRTVIWDGEPRTMIIGEFNFGEVYTTHNSEVIDFGILEDSQFTDIVDGNMDPSDVLRRHVLPEKRMVVNPEVISAIKNAKKAITIGPGSFISSTGAVLLYPEVAEALIDAVQRGVHVIQIVNPGYTNEDVNISVKKLFEMQTRVISDRLGRRLRLGEYVTDVILNDITRTSPSNIQVLSGKAITKRSQDSTDEEVDEHKYRGPVEVYKNDESYMYLSEELGEGSVHIAPLVMLLKILRSKANRTTLSWGITYNRDALKRQFDSIINKPNAARDGTHADEASATGNSTGAYGLVLKQQQGLLDVRNIKDLVRRSGWTLGQILKEERDVNMDPEGNPAIDPSLPVVLLLGGGGGSRMQLPEGDPNYGLPKILLTLDAGDGVRWSFISLIRGAIRHAGMQGVVVLPGRKDFNEVISKACEGMPAVTQQYPLGTAHAALQVSRLLEGRKDHKGVDYDGPVVVVSGDTPLVTSAMLRHLAESCQDSFDDRVVASVLVGTLDNPLNPANYGKVIIDENTGDCLAMIEQKDIDEMIVLGGGSIIKDAANKVVERICPECTTEEQRLTLLEKGGAKLLARGRIITAQEADESKYWNSNMWGIQSKEMMRLLSSITSDNSSSEFYITDIAMKALDAGKRVRGYVCNVKESRCLAGVNYPSQLIESNKFLRQRMAAENLEKLRQQAIDTYIREYGVDPQGVVWVPSRICKVGEHIDYVRYFQSRVLTFASAEYGMFVAYGPRSDQTVTVASTLKGFPREEFSLQGAPDDNRDWFEYLAKEVGVPERDWANYAKGAFYHLQNRQMRKLRGANIAVASNIPPAGGASSSSALTVANGYVARLVNGIPVDLNELADASSEAETFVGTRGGKMDQATIALGLPDMALSIRFDPFNVQPVDMPTGYEFVTFFTTEHAKGSQITSEFNERSAISRFVIPAILAKLFEERPDLEKKWLAFKEAIVNSDLDAINRLRGDIEENVITRLPQRMTLTRIAREYPDAYNQISGDDAYKALFDCKSKAGKENSTGRDVPLKVRNLSRHHIGEIVRTIAAEQLVAKAAQKQREGDNEACDEIMQQVGDIMCQTHVSLRKFYDVSTPDIEKVMDIVRPKSSKKRISGVMGGRLMGGGFGGSVVAVVKNEAVNTLINAVQEDYYKLNGRDGVKENAIHIHTPGTGATYEPFVRAAAAGAVKAMATGMPFSFSDLSEFVNKLDPHLQEAIKVATRARVEVVNLTPARIEEVSLNYPFGCSQAAHAVKRLLLARYGEQIQADVIAGYHKILNEQPLEEREELASKILHFALIIKNTATGERYYLSFFEGQFKIVYAGRISRLVKVIETGEVRRVARPECVELYERGGFSLTPPVLIKLESDEDIYAKGGLEVLSAEKAEEAGVVLEKPDHEIGKIIEHLPREFRPSARSDKATPAKITAAEEQAIQAKTAEGYALVVEPDEIKRADIVLSLRQEFKFIDVVESVDIAQAQEEIQKIRQNGGSIILVVNNTGKDLAQSILGNIGEAAVVTVTKPSKTAAVVRQSL